MATRKTKPRSKPSPQLAAFQATQKRESFVIGPVERLLLSRSGVDPDRRQDRIHPSEMCKNDWCHRATYYRLAGVEPKVKEKANSFRLELIFGEGHDIHGKWQTWLWDAGTLYGTFECLACKWQWHECSPVLCPNCQAGRKYMRYREVPIEDAEHLIIGHADADVGDGLVEIKSIGIGTVRIEAPPLLAKHTHEVEVADGRTKKLVDLEGVWRDIKRPFPSHIKQGNLYCRFYEHKRISFLYECKWNQGNREFVLRYQPEIVEPLLDACLDIKYALAKGSPPPCPFGGCNECRRYEDSEARGDGGHHLSVVPAGTDSPRPPRRRRARPAAAAEGLDADAGRSGTLGDDRPQAHELAGTVHSLGGLLQRPGGIGRDQRAAS